MNLTFGSAVVMTKWLPFVFITVLGCTGAAPTNAQQSQNGITSVNKATVNHTSFPYDLAQPYRQWTLPEQLAEVSGIAAVDKNHVLVIEDLHPVLYLCRLDKELVIEQKITFAQTHKDKFDIEDVTIHNDTVYALWSHGKIFRITHWRQNPQVEEYTTPLNKENNPEGLCYDSVTGKLLIACKETPGADQEKKSARAIYSFNLQTNKMDAQPLLLIRKKELERKGAEEMGFYPSAVAIQPGTGNIVVLSSRETKALAVLDRRGNVLLVTMLDPQRFLQPEGVAFTPDGTLYISSEGKHGQPPVLYAFAPVQ